MCKMKRRYIYIDYIAKYKWKLSPFFTRLVVKRRLSWKGSNIWKKGFSRPPRRDLPQGKQPEHYQGSHLRRGKVQCSQRSQEHHLRHGIFCMMGQKKKISSEPSRGIEPFDIFVSSSFQLGLVCSGGFICKFLVGLREFTKVVYAGFV